MARQHSTVTPAEVAPQAFSRRKRHLKCRLLPRQHMWRDYVIWRAMACNIFLVTINIKIFIKNGLTFKNYPLAFHASHFAELLRSVSHQQLRSFLENKNRRIKELRRYSQKSHLGPSLGDNPRDPCI